MKSIKKKIGLFIAHHIFLTKEERYRLIDGHSTEVIGASFPVWLENNKPLEPSTEVFCKYKLVNNDSKTEIEYSKKLGGYTIHLPRLPKDYKKPYRPTDDEWRAMKLKEQEMWYKKNKTPASAANLRDISDGGAEHLRFNEKLEIQKKSGILAVSHDINIGTIESLLESLL